MVTRLPVDDAARYLGISRPTVKRRLKSGALKGVQERTPSGFKWFVVLDTPESPPGTPGESPAGVPGESPPESAALSQMSPQAALQRAQDMAAYTAALLEPLHARLEAQAEEIGTLKERCATLQAQLAERAEATNGRTHESAAPETERRSWWQRLVAWG